MGHNASAGGAVVAVLGGRGAGKALKWEFIVFLKENIGFSKAGKLPGAPKRRAGRPPERSMARPGGCWALVGGFWALGGEGSARGAPREVFGSSWELISTLWGQLWVTLELIF